MKMINPTPDELRELERDMHSGMAPLWYAERACRFLPALLAAFRERDRLQNALARELQVYPNDCDARDRLQRIADSGNTS